MLHFVLLYNALTLLGSIIASLIYRFGHNGVVIALIVTALSLYINAIASIRYRFPVIIYLLFNGSNSLDLNVFFAG